ncbi:uncharacterized protein DUF4249 [Gillisia sp. Hel_I_86]|uniref:DUF4249 domain-containing protein n=1 Tax=Gillisia sp. Hel_I_86 TaxID=1249981 RepID=UPI00119A6831|nr:DUF4249 domain-containing protein [Gillisia sp. Hel_I_86]TVZ25396.1 uncharacterized protein DUF4249 [Gillisia sp. Hel_I_86]
MRALLNMGFFLMLLILSSCEEVVEVDLQESEPKLVVEASIIWEKESLGNNQYIILSSTTSFYNSENPPAEGANVIINSATEETYQFTEISPGIYENTNFKPELYKSYTLSINYKNEFYTASEKMIPVVDLENIEQTSNGGFNGNDIELKAYYSDPSEIKNYYLLKFFFENTSLQIYNDEFTNGNRTFAYFSDEDLKSGDQVNFEIQGVSERFYEYLYILSSQAGENNGGPFQTQPTTVRGNIVNTTTPENFAFGYFRLSQSDTLTYLVE